MEIIVEGKDAKVYVNDEAALGNDLRLIVKGENANVFIDAEPLGEASPNLAAYIDTNSDVGVEPAKPKEPTEKEQFVGLLNKMLARTSFKYKIDEDHLSNVVLTIDNSHGDPVECVVFLFDDEGVLWDVYID